MHQPEVTIWQVIGRIGRWIVGRVEGGGAGVGLGSAVTTTRVTSTTTRVTSMGVVAAGGVPGVS